MRENLCSGGFKALPGSALILRIVSGVGWIPFWRRSVSAASPIKLLRINRFYLKASGKFESSKSVKQSFNKKYLCLSIIRYDMKNLTMEIDSDN